MSTALDGPASAQDAVEPTMQAAPSLAVAVVLHKPDLRELTACLDALAQSLARIDSRAAVHLWHCDEGPAATPGLTEVLARLQHAGLTLRSGGGAGNLGFGNAINALLPDVASSHLLVLNQDAIPEPGALDRLWRRALADSPDVAAWELRQIPYEHPKDYDPLSGETGWVSGAAVLLRTDALRAVGGFEPRFFMYCEDVDLSWRLRCAGWRLRYVPQCAVVHRTYAQAGQIKPLAALQGYYANLCLRARFADRSLVTEGLHKLGQELRGPQPFPGRRRGIVAALMKFARNYSYFRRTHRAAPGFVPRFNAWDYEERREGAFHAFLAQAERSEPLPPVSAILRARSDARALADALRCLAQQTQPLHEVIVVGGSELRLRDACSEAAERVPLRPLPASPAPLAAIAAVHAWADWWLLFEDEHVLPYADHAEVLLQAALARNLPAAASLTWLIEADPADHAAAHRLHAPRTTLAGVPAARPTRLLHRHGSLDPAYAAVVKTTALRYVEAGAR